MSPESAPIFSMSAHRLPLLAQAKRETEKQWAESPDFAYLSESLYLERARLRKEKINLFTLRRRLSDQRHWAQVARALSGSSMDFPRPQVRDLILRHYGNEIAGSFDPKVYQWATRLVPWGMNWLLNAASLRQFVPWKMREHLLDRLEICGQVESLKKLSKRGTILLVPTHQSNLDSLLVGYVIFLMGLPPFCYGAGLNLFSNPILGYFMSHLGAYTVDRKKHDPLYKDLLKNYSSALLERGIHSLFFPGGGRSRSGAIERHLKLGLLGTAVQAQAQVLKKDPTQRIFVVPMVVSYHSVLEASSLIEEYLSERGGSRYLAADSDSLPWISGLQFLWQFFSQKSQVTVRVGQALDVFGNWVDGDGKSLGPNRTEINVRSWLTTRGVLGPNPDRDAEYTRELGRAITHRFLRENTVLSSHLVAFSLYEQLRLQNLQLPFYRFLRLPIESRALSWGPFLSGLRSDFERVRSLADQGQLHLSQELLSESFESWAKSGIQKLNYLQSAPVIQHGEGEVVARDMQSLYYYRNRMTGYGLERFAE